MADSRLADDHRLAAGFSALLLAAVLTPIRQNWRDSKRDGFPLSYYPMFSARRGKRYRVTHVVGIGAAGERTPIPHRLAGPGGLNQVRRQLNRTVADGRAPAACRTIARRVAGDRDPRLARVVRVEIVTGDYRLDDFFRGRREPRRLRVHAARQVVRGRE